MLEHRIGVVIHKPLRDQLFAPDDWERLVRLAPVKAVDSCEPLSVAEAIHLLDGCTIGVGSWNTPFPNRELMEACPSLVLWEHGAGSVKHMFGPHLNGRDLIIASCKTAIADSVAEMVLAEITLGLRGVFQNGRANQPGIPAKPDHTRTLYRAKIGVIGASEVGKRVINLLRPFGCRILLYDPFVSVEHAREMGVELYPDLTSLCANCDAVTLHTPNIPECKGMVGAREFQAMQDETVFVNTARGDCIDEQALISELEKGRLFAILDVSSPEPAAQDSPLRTLPNVLYTSHIAGPPGFHIGNQVVNDIEAYIAGGLPLCIVTADQLSYTA